MAERRMFAKTIVLSDAFLDMPMSARCLYFTLGMLADDDGFVNQPRSIMRQCGASEDDMKMLIAKKFVLLFESGIIVIKHWRINNYLRSDRYQKTIYTDEKQQLEIGEDGNYHIGIPSNGIPYMGIPSIGKDRLGKDSIENTKGKFVKPTIEEIQAYITENNLNVDAEYFFNYYESNGWMLGRTHMKKWKSALQTWSKRESKPKNGNVTIQMPKFMEDQKNGVVIDDAPASEETLRKFRERNGNRT